MHSSIESARQQHLIHQITLCNMEPTIIYVQITLWNIEPTFTSEDYIVGHRAHDVITADYMKPTDICKNDIAGHETDDHITISISAPQRPSINGASQSINALDPNTLKCQWCTRWVSDSAHSTSMRMVDILGGTIWIASCVPGYVRKYHLLRCRRAVNIFEE